MSGMACGHHAGTAVLGAGAVQRSCIRLSSSLGRPSGWWLSHLPVGHSCFLPSRHQSRPHVTRVMMAGSMRGYTERPVELQRREKPPAWCHKPRQPQQAGQGEQRANMHVT